MRFSFILACLAITHAFASEATESHDARHAHELGVAQSPVYFIKEKTLSYGLHLHYVYNLPRGLGIGIGYEKIFDEHRHQTFGIVAGYRPTHAWVINVSPGMTIEENSLNTKQFAVHVETAYEFEIWGMHFGPAAEWAYDPEDFHVSLGLHIGLGF